MTYEERAEKIRSIIRRDVPHRLEYASFKNEIAAQIREAVEEAYPNAFARDQKSYLKARSEALEEAELCYAGSVDSYKSVCRDRDALAIRLGKLSDQIMERIAIARAAALEDAAKIVDPNDECEPMCDQEIHEPNCRYVIAAQIRARAKETKIDMDPITGEEY